MCSDTLGILQMHLPASAYTECSSTPYPRNTLFGDLDGLNIKYEDLKKYLGLVLALFDGISPKSGLCRL